ncbi:MAG: FTR1 family protein [Rickettsiales bacterium]|nr:FTR1 family protein [Rickettsiales bacterium]
MFQIAIVVFREILEVALIVGILVAATKNILNRSKWILSGVACGFLASLILAFFTDKISESLNGVGQEVFNGVILLSASIMISSTVLWMQKHAKSLSGELKKLGNAIREGNKPLYALLLVTFFSVLRESAEIVLFTYSSYISGVELSEIILGLLIGVVSGSLVGAALYFGIIKASGKYFFIVTTWILVFLASGITASGVGFFINAEILPSLGDQIWDTSMVISQTSFVGKILNIFLGYIDRPSGMQVLAYLTNLMILVIGLKLIKKGA